MTNNEVTVPDIAEGVETANVDCEELTISGKIVQRQRIQMVGALESEIASVINSAPVAQYGVVTRNIPSGTQPISHANLDVATSTRLSESTYTSRQPVQGQSVMATSVPVAISSDQSAIPVTLSEPISVDDNAGSITVDAPAATPVAMAITNTSDVLVKAGDAVNNAVRVNLVAGGAGDGALLDGVSGTIKATVLDYTNSNPLAVRLTDTNGDFASAGGGTQYTEDVASAADPIGTQLIARRRDALATETTTDGDNTAVNSTGKGELYVKHIDSIPITSATLATDAELATKLDETTFTTRIPVQGQAVMASSVPVVIASNQSAVPVSGTVAVTGVATLTEQQTQTIALQLIDDAVYATNGAISKTVAISGQLDDAAITDATENNCAPVRITTKRAIHTNLRNDGGTEIGTAAAPIRTDPTGSTTQPVSGTVSINTIPTGDNNIGNVDIVSGVITTVSTLTNQSQEGGVAISLNTGVRDTGTRRVTIATDDLVQCVGSIAHDTGDSGNPVKIGGKARTTNPTAVADADRVDGTFDDIGRQVVVLNQVRDLVNDTTITIAASTAETTLIAQTASTFHDIVLLTVANTSATATRVDFRSTTAGSVRFSLYCPAGATIGFAPPVPVKQTTVNTNWTATCITSLTDLRIFAQYIDNV